MLQPGRPAPPVSAPTPSWRQRRALSRHRLVHGLGLGEDRGDGSSLEGVWSLVRDTRVSRGQEYGGVRSGGTHERFPKLKRFPVSLLSEALVRRELQERIPIFKAMRAVQKRFELLLAKQPEGLTTAEREALDGYEALDDYFNFANRVMRNLILAEQHT